VNEEMINQLLAYGREKLEENIEEGMETYLVVSGTFAPMVSHKPLHPLNMIEVMREDLEAEKIPTPEWVFLISHVEFGTAQDADGNIVDPIDALLLIGADRDGETLVLLHTYANAGTTVFWDDEYSVLEEDQRQSFEDVVEALQDFFREVRDGEPVAAG